MFLVVADNQKWRFWTSHLAFCSCMLHGNFFALFIDVGSLVWVYWAILWEVILFKLCYSFKSYCNPFLPICSACCIANDILLDKVRVQRISFFEVSNFKWRQTWLNNPKILLFFWSKYKNYFFGENYLIFTTSNILRILTHTLHIWSW